MAMDSSTHISNAFADAMLRILVPSDTVVRSMFASADEGATELQEAARRICRQVMDGKLKEPQTLIHAVQRNPAFPEPVNAIHALQFLQLAADMDVVEEHVTLYTMKSQRHDGILGSLLADLEKVSMPVQVLDNIGHWSKAMAHTTLFALDAAGHEKGKHEFLLGPVDPVCTAMDHARFAPPDTPASLARYVDRLVPGVLFTTMTDDPSVFTHAAIHKYRRRMNNNGLHKKQVSAAIERCHEAITTMLGKVRFSDHDTTRKEALGLLEYARVRLLEGAVLLGIPSLATLRFEFITEVSALHTCLEAQAVRLNRLAMGDMEHEFWPACYVGPVQRVSFVADGPVRKYAWIIDANTKRLM